MLPSDTALLLFLSVAACIHVAALAFIIAQVRDSRRMAEESPRLTQAVGVLVLQEAEKIRRLVTTA